MGDVGVEKGISSPSNLIYLFGLIKWKVEGLCDLFSLLNQSIPIGLPLSSWAAVEKACADESPGCWMDWNSDGWRK